MAAMSWLMNLDFAAGTGSTPAATSDDRDRIMLQLGAAAKPMARAKRGRGYPVLRCILLLLPLLT